MPWYNKYRPQSFTEVTGQSLVIKILQNSLQQDQVKQSYLFSGPKGIGKTTLARIFANELNEIKNNPEAGIDILEMDAASNTGIDDIRQLIESAKTPPISGKYKIFIIDEVHMLSKSAMNALLKILEEPPKYLVFLLATTNPEKLLPTVLSRLTVFKLKPHSVQDITQRLAWVAEQEGLNFESSALQVIAKHSTGSLRDGVNLLETVASHGLNIYSSSDITQILGLLATEKMDALAQRLLSKEGFEVEFLAEFESLGLDGNQLLEQLFEYLLDLELAGEDRFRNLIWPLAKVIDLRLPLTTPSQTLALLQVRVVEDLQIQKTYKTGFIAGGKSSKEPEQTSETTLEPKPKTPEIKKTKTPETSPESDTEVVKLKPESPAQPKQELKPEVGEENQPSSTASKDLSQPAQELQEVLKKQSLKPETPPILKLVLPDLQVLKLENQTLFLAVSSPLFQTQLENSVNQNWITNFLAKEFGLEVQEFSIQQKSKNQEVSPDSKTAQNLASKPNQNPQKAAPKPDSPTLTSKNPPFQVVDSKPKAQETSKQTFPDTDENPIFYKAYKRLPGNLADSEVPVIHKLTNPKSDEWHQEAESMFEFE